MTVRKMVAVAVAVSSLAGCGTNDAKSAWNDVVKKCAASDLTAKTVLYFGPTNNVGPGSIWREGPEGGYRLRWTDKDLTWASNVVQPGGPLACEGKVVADFSGKASVGLTSLVAPASGELAGDLKRARTISAKANALAWDTIKEGPYEQHVNNLPQDSGVKQELHSGTRLVMVRALRVSGFTADLTFSQSDAASLKAKFNGEITSGVDAELSAGLSATWTNDTTLKISASDFYIAGELGQYTSTGFATAETEAPKAVDIVKGPVAREKT